MMHTKSCTKGTVVRLSQRRKRRLLDWRLFRSWIWWFFFVQNEENVVWGKFDSCTNRNYVLTDYELSGSTKYVSQCDLILDQRFCACKPKLRVNRVRTKRKWLYWVFYPFVFTAYSAYRCGVPGIHHGVCPPGARLQYKSEFTTALKRELRQTRPTVTRSLENSFFLYSCYLFGEMYFNLLVRSTLQHFFFFENVFPFLLPKAFCKHACSFSTMWGGGGGL